MKISLLCLIFVCSFGYFQLAEGASFQRGWTELSTPSLCERLLIYSSIFSAPPEINLINENILKFQTALSKSSYSNIISIVADGYNQWKIVYSIPNSELELMLFLNTYDKRILHFKLLSKKDAIHSFFFELNIEKLNPFSPIFSWFNQLNRGQMPENFIENLREDVLYPAFRWALINQFEDNRWKSFMRLIQLSSAGTDSVLFDMNLLELQLQNRNLIGLGLNVFAGPEGTFNQTLKSLNFSHKDRVVLGFFSAVDISDLMDRSLDQINPNDLIIIIFPENKSSFSEVNLSSQKEPFIFSSSEINVSDFFKKIHRTHLDKINIMNRVHKKLLTLNREKLSELFIEFYRDPDLSGFEEIKIIESFIVSDLDRKDLNLEEVLLDLFARMSDDFFYVFVESILDNESRSGHLFNSSNSIFELLAFPDFDLERYITSIVLAIKSGHIPEKSRVLDQDFSKIPFPKKLKSLR